MIVKAWIKKIPGDYRSEAHCGRCGQYLWTIEGSPVEHPARLDATARGWRYNADEQQWEPSKRHEKQRRKARKRLREGRSADPSGDRERLMFGRDLWSDTAFSKAPAGLIAGSDSAFLLPTKIACPRCLLTNVVDGPGEST